MPVASAAWDPRPNGRQILGLLSVKRFANKSELARELGRINGRPVARQQVYTIVKEAIRVGFLDGNPFTDMPQMRRDR